MKKVKLCLIVSELKSGGVESFIINYFKKIDKTEYRLFIMTHNKPNKKISKTFTELGFKILYVPPKKKNIIKSLYYINKYMKKYKFDIVHSNLFKTNFIYLMIAKKNNVKLRIAHSHNSEYKFKILNNFIYSLLHKLNLKYANYYIGCSNNALLYGFGNKVFDTNRYKVLYNAINVNEYKFNKSKREKIRKDLSIKDNEILLCNIGRFTKQKNHIFLINMFNKLNKINNNYKLLLIGDGTLKDNIRLLINEYNLEKNIIILDSFSDVKDYYSAMDIFLLPSLYEGMPLVIVESLSNGLKVICSKCFNKKEINESIIDINLEEELWIESILNINKEYKRINKIKNTKYDIDIAYKDLEKIYGELKNEKSREINK